MTITKITKDTTIEPGQYVCFDSMMLGGVCSYPRKVTKVAGQRIYALDKHEEKESFKSRQTAVFLCTDKNEGIALSAISLNFVHERHTRMVALEAAIVAERSAAIDAMIAASIGGAA